mgnify:CR=1 FL=1
MRLFLEDEGALDLKLPYEELATKVADAVLDYEKCPYEAQVELLLTMNEEIRQMNLEFRGIDRATDVLSFPMTEFPSPADYAYLDTDDSSFDPETGELILGDIIVSVEKVIEQAEKYGHSRERELAFLIAHSMLHLCGYDHMEDAEREVMETRQREILAGEGYHR